MAKVPEENVWIDPLADGNKAHPDSRSSSGSNRSLTGKKTSGENGS